jgi:hypothetical protein
MHPIKHQSVKMLQRDIKLLDDIGTNSIQIILFSVRGIAYLNLRHSRYTGTKKEEKNQRTMERNFPSRQALS